MGLIMRKILYTLGIILATTIFVPVFAQAIEVTPNTVLEDITNQNSYSVQKTNSDPNDRVFILNISNSNLLTNTAQVTFYIDRGTYIANSQTLKATDPGCVNQHSVIAIPQELKNASNGYEQPLGNFKGVATNLYEGKKPKLTIVFKAQTSFSSSTCPKLAEKFDRNLQSKTETNEKSIVADRVVIDETAKRANDKYGDTISRYLTGYLNDFAASPWLKNLSNEDKKAAGCTSIGGSYNCDSSMHGKLFQQMVNSCVSSSVTIMKNQTFGQDTSKINENISKCISTNLYGSDEESDKIADLLQGNVSFEDLDKKLDEAKQETLETLNSPSPNDDGEGATCIIEGVGWIVCPAMTFIAKLNDSVFSLIETLLSINPDMLSTNSSTYKAWTIFRDLANIVFVILFLVVIFSQISSIGVSNYGIKKIVPKLIVGAILINISFFVCQLAVDLSEILGHSLKGVLESIGGQTISEIAKQSNWVNIIGVMLSGTATAVAGIAVAAIGIYALIAIGIPGALMFLLSVVVTLLILTGRQAAVILFVVISPLAFAAWLLPNTEHLFKKWSKMFMGLLLVFPTVSLLFGAGALASQVFQANTGDILMQLIALIVSGVPLIATPSLLKNSMNSLGSIGGKISGIAGAINSRTGSYGKNRLKTSALGQRVNEFSKARQQRRAMKIANRRAGNGRLGGISKKLDQGKFGKFMGWDKGSYAASAAVDKVAEEEAANILQYDLNGDYARGLNSDNKHVQRLSAEALSKQGDYGANVLAQHLKNGGQITSVGMAKAFSDVKKSHVGVAKAGTEAIKSLQGKDSPGAVSFNAQQIKDFTATEINGLSAGQLATQTTTAIEDAVIKDANGNEVSAISAEKALSTLNDPTIKGTMSGATEAALRSIAGPLQQQRQQAAQQQAAQQQAAQQRRDQNLEDIAQYVRKSNSKT